jgi:aspartokinase/homoserine dehydrogenase 1
MELEVLKFGGSSLETAAAMRRVADVLWERRSTQRIVVCSAMGGITNALLDAGRRAAARDEGYKVTCSTIRQRHEEALEGLGVVADVVRAVLIGRRLRRQRGEHA